MMIKNRQLLLVAFLMSISVGVAHAQTIYVDQASGNDANSGLTPGTAVATVTEGFNKLGSTGTLNIGPGTYSPTNGETYPTGATGNVTIEGAGAGSTILDGEGASQVLSLGSSGATVIMRGVTIRDGDAGIGGGVYLTEPAVSRIIECRFENNNAGIGGGVHIQIDSGIDVEMIIAASEFIGNTANIGAGLQFQQNGGGSPTLTIVDSEFTNNIGIIGGAIQFQENGGGTHTMVVDRSVFRNNPDPGINFQRNAGSAVGVITNSIFADDPSTALQASDTDLRLVNTSFDSNGIALSATGPIDVVNGIFWDNATEISGSGGTVSFSIVQGLEIGGHSDGGNNFSADPLFDANQRLTAGSPAIDQGSTAAARALDLMLDIDRNDRTFDVPGVPNGPGWYIDRGAHEFGSGPIREVIPTLSRWSMILLALALGGVGLLVAARR